MERTDWQATEKKEELPVMSEEKKSASDRSDWPTAHKKPAPVFTLSLLPFSSLWCRQALSARSSLAPSCLAGSGDHCTSLGAA
jgi:hypothetical protein